jgi:hypothetical protein
MEVPLDRASAAVPRTIDRELEIIRAAVGLVAAGGSPRVVLAGLRFGETLLVESRKLAAAAGVHVVPLWTTRSEGADLAIEPGLE